LSSRAPRRAFTLLEVLIAGAITLIAVTAAVGTLSMAFRFVAERKLRTTAEMVAQSHMELLLATAASRPLQSSDCAPVRYTRAVVGEEDLSGVFTATCAIAADTPSTPTRRVDRLTVQIEASVDGRRIQTSFVTYLVGTS
jgi:Tfp pilus assembly protein PilV